MTRPQDNTAARWYGAAQLVGLVRAEPGITRATAAQRLGISSGGATDLVARLKAHELLDEIPAPSRGRGRPTTVLQPHARGPLVIAADLRPKDWRLAIADIGGQPEFITRTPLESPDPAQLVDEVASAIREAHDREPGRIRAVSVSVAGTVSDDRLVQFTPRGWSDVDLSPLTADLPRHLDIPLLIGNDATLAGLAEARTGAAHGAGTALHLMIGVGLGGTLVVDGHPAMGAHGAAGEYGHIPFGDPTRLCPCGARGCWDLTLDGRAIATHLGEDPPVDPITYARNVLANTVPDKRIRDAFDAVATSIGRGIAGLVNLHDPDVVTLGGLAPSLRAAASTSFEAAYLQGLMAFRKNSAPPVLDGVHGDDGPLHGAIAIGIDHITSESSLAEWARQ
ncbi:ROK family transcriptional regulator [Rhodococcoides kyotonense]|uniref:Sugar kinase of the NBD/HSP70 family, may contain an N-terminal HTH domain n=1 Tax=Rhodococcoides kyotonense TaxID=398843 RepID=A0A239DRC5_9NOCA|nr:Sugar kinase of the NBD/HSP70 family, may contain an N-terminal HTH domain [Rhodococcus kyotonensis]